METRYLILLMSGFLMGEIIKADFSGQWEGTGRAWASTSWKADCEIIQVEVRQTPTKLQRHSGGAKCGTLTTTEDPIELEIRGNELWFDDNKVGNISDTSLSITAASGPFTVSYRARLIDSKTISYEEKLSGNDGYLIIQGTLRR